LIERFLQCSEAQTNARQYSGFCYFRGSSRQRCDV